MELEIFRLNLVSPLFYVPLEGADPFARREEAERGPRGETLFCFELNEGERLKFEPDETGLLGNPVFGGAAAEGAFKGEEASGRKLLQLPPGNYLFAQKREALGREAIARMAAEIQQEALWRRLEPGKKLYLRRLFEDGGFVTQLFRPCGPECGPPEQPSSELFDNFSCRITSA